MMAVRSIAPALIDRLPEVRGRYEANAPLAPLTWFRVGGAAEVLYRPADAGDLATFVAGCPDDVPLTVVGVGSNLLVRDGGVPGVVVRLGKPFSGIAVAGLRITAGGGALDVTVAATARDHGLTGLEFLRGVPGSVGGGVAMNAGAYGREMADIVEAVMVLTRDGGHRVLTPRDLDFGYRHTHLPGDAIVVEVVMVGHPGDKIAIQAEMDRIAAEREESQPLRTRTGGSTFKNPPGDKAWRLIDAAGCRGLRIGGAQVSEKHCNFLINSGGATANDLERLGEEVRRRVLDTTGQELEWEIRRIGVPGVTS